MDKFVQQVNEVNNKFVQGIVNELNDKFVEYDKRTYSSKDFELPTNLMQASSFEEQQVHGMS